LPMGQFIFICFLIYFFKKMTNIAFFPSLF